MNIDIKSAVSLFFWMPAALALAICFIFLPDGWNLIPLALLALVLAGCSGKFRMLRGAPSGQPSPAPTAGGIRAAAGSAPEPIPALARRANRVFGPIIAGMLIDLLDLATFGPVGLLLGLPIGGLAGYWMGKALGLSRRASAWCALAAGVYCAIPGTEYFPLATIIGACARFQESGRRPGPGAANSDDSGKI